MTTLDFTNISITEFMNIIQKYIDKIEIMSEMPIVFYYYQNNFEVHAPKNHDFASQNNRDMDSKFNVISRQQKVGVKCKNKIMACNLLYILRMIIDEYNNYQIMEALTSIGYALEVEYPDPIIYGDTVLPLGTYPVDGFVDYVNIYMKDNVSHTDINDKNLKESDIWDSTKIFTKINCT
jgi:hypothetical protein